MPASSAELQVRARSRLADSDRRVRYHSTFVRGDVRLKTSTRSRNREGKNYRDRSLLPFLSATGSNTHGLLMTLQAPVLQRSCGSCCPPRFSSPTTTSRAPICCTSCSSWTGIACDVSTRGSGARGVRQQSAGSHRAGPDGGGPGLRSLPGPQEREETRLIPIVIVTAQSDRRERLRGIEAGADDFLSKPFDPVELARGSDRSCG